MSSISAFQFLACRIPPAAVFYFLISTFNLRDFRLSAFRIAELRLFHRDLAEITARHTRKAAEKSLKAFGRVDRKFRAVENLTALRVWMRGYETRKPADNRFENHENGYTSA